MFFFFFSFSSSYQISWRRLRMWLLLAFQREKQRSWNTFFILWFFFFFDESATSVTSQLQRPLRLRRFVTLSLSLSLHSAHSISNNIFAEIEPCHVARSHWSGVIWKGDELIDGVPQTLEMLRAKGKKLVFVTNNSWKSRSQYADKFRSLGISVSQVRFWFEDLDVVLWIVVVIFFFLFFFARMRYSPRLLRLLCTWRSTISHHKTRFLAFFSFLFYLLPSHKLVLLFHLLPRN